MIPAEVVRCLKAVDAPSLFAQENREACEAVHKHVRQVIEQGTETTTIPVDANLLAQVEEVLKGIRLDGRRIRCAFLHVVRRLPRTGKGVACQMQEW